MSRDHSEAVGDSRERWNALAVEPVLDGSGRPLPAQLEEAQLYCRQRERQGVVWVCHKLSCQLMETWCGHLRYEGRAARRSRDGDAACQRRQQQAPPPLSLLLPPHQRVVSSAAHSTRITCGEGYLQLYGAPPELKTRPSTVVLFWRGFSGICCAFLGNPLLNSKEFARVWRSGQWHCQPQRRSGETRATWNDGAGWQSTQGNDGWDTGRR